MKKALYYAITVIGVAWAQILVNHLSGGSWFSFDVVLISVVFYGLRRGPLAAQWLGLAWGLLIDAASLGFMGVHTLLYAFAGYFSGMLMRQLDASKMWTQALFSFGASCVHLAAYYGLLKLLVPSDQGLSWVILLRPIVNACLAPIAFALLDWWSDAWGLYPVER